MFIGVFLITQFVLASAVAILINKSTEGGRFDFVKPYLREAWFAIAVIYTMIALWQGREVSMALKSRIPSISAGYILASSFGAILLCFYWWAIGWTLGNTAVSPGDGPNSGWQQDTKQQEDQKKPSVRQSSQGANSPNTSIIGNNNAVNIGDPKVAARLDEITKLLKEQQGDSTSPKKLLTKYPLGYVIFDVDYKNSVFPYRSQALDNWDFDWNVVRITSNSDEEIAIQIPTIRRKGDSRTMIGGVGVGGEKAVGPFPRGAKYIWTDFTIGMKGEILAIRENGIVFLIGFTHVETRK